MTDCENADGHVWIPLEKIIASNGDVVYVESVCGYCDETRESGVKA